MRATIVTAALAGVLVSLAPAAVAGAADDVPTPTVKIELAKGLVGTSSPLTVAGQRVVIHGVVKPYRPGQTVTVRVRSGEKKVYVKAMAVQRQPGTVFGEFTLGYTPKVTGTLRVQASHLATPELGTARANEKSFTVVTSSVSPGEKSPSVRLLQRLLAAKGYVTGVRGTFDDETQRAVLAFRKVSDMDRTEVASPDVFRRLLDGGGAFKVRYPEDGHHVEGDLTHQVIALIDHGKVQRIYPISSGKPSTPTVTGRFHVYYKTPGINEKGMVDSNYFIAGYAIHGYAEVPIYPASHGCLRTPVPDALSIYDWIKMGDPVDVYWRPGTTPPWSITTPQIDASA